MSQYRTFQIWDNEEKKSISVEGRNTGGEREWKALCPKHDDKNPSLSINEEKELFTCFGCDFHGHLYDPAYKSKGNSDKKILATYDYQDEAGNLLYQVVRYEPKDFRVRRPDGKGGWINDIKGIELIPYRLPEIQKAQRVLNVEGCKDVESLHMIGIPATTNPFGAGKWRSEFNKYFKGKDVILIPDNDPIGKQHIVDVASSLNGTPKSLKIVNLPENVKDVTDYILSFKDPQEAVKSLEKMIESAAPYTPPKIKTIEDIIITSQEFHSLDIPKRSCHLYPWFKENSIILISGERGIGKSFFAHLIANSIRKGQSCGLWDCQLSAPILLIDGEMSTNDLQERIEVLGLNTDGLSPLLIYSDAWASQHGISRAHLMDDAWREKIKGIILKYHVKILILDNIASLASGVDENSKKDWDPVNQWLIELRFIGTSTVMLHHTSKAGSQRGTSAREDNLDISIMLKRPGDYVPEDGCRFIVCFTKARVSQDALTLIGDTEFQLSQDNDGKYEFTTKNVRKAVKDDILRMLGEGTKQNSIAETLHVDKAYVSRIAKGIKK